MNMKGSGHLQYWYNNCFHYIVLSRYMLMLQCWEFEAKNRPTFSMLVSSLSQILEAMADYMDISGTIIPNSNFLNKKTEPDSL